MNTPESINSKSENLFSLISKNWENLDDSHKSTLTKIWKILTYKWQLQILFNLPFLIWWGLDKSITKVHEFDLYVLNYLHIPEWVLSYIGFGK
tara:strand:+ start:126 stop:404 length:279 start_codon:yes stop_codon:yes gene_type:complete